MDMDANFKKDILEFLKLINNSNEQSKIKKYYFSLVKKYHPDSASSELKNKAMSVNSVVKHKNGQAIVYKTENYQLSPRL